MYCNERTEKSSILNAYTRFFIFVKDLAEMITSFKVKELPIK